MTKIILKNASVDYEIHNTKTQSLKSKIVKSFTGGIIRYNAHDSSIKVSALSDISLSIIKGDKIGIIGNNGAGKTTILRVLSGIYEPTNGFVEITGNVLPLIDINLGLDSDATGIQNIKLRSVMMGIDENDFEDYLTEVVKFADIGEFIYLPMRTYSSGMQLRLSFAASTVISPDILIMDEWISTGDENFSKKANIKLKEIIDKTNILILASHNLKLIEELCNKVLWLEKGKVKMFDKTEKVLKVYAK